MPAKACPGERPEARRPCLRVPCAPQWRLGAWSQCSASCGLGIQQRQVVCRAGTNSLGQCDGDRPDAVQICSLPPCAEVQNATVEANNRELESPQGSPSAPRHPAGKVPPTEPCVGDRSPFCSVDVLGRYCSIAGYRRLCCETCSRRALHPDPDPNPSLASPPAFSAPGSPVPPPTDPPDTAGKAASEGPPRGPHTPLPGPLDMSNPGTQQHPWVTQTPSPGVSGNTFRSPAGASPWAPTEASPPTSQGPDPQHPGTSFSATTLVT